MAQITKTHSAGAYAIACGELEFATVIAALKAWQIALDRDEFDSSLVDQNIGTLTVIETAELIADLESAR